MFRLADIVRTIGTYTVVGELPASLTFEMATFDSREARPGSLFIARRGERDDGHRYIADAYRRGASGVLAERLPEGEFPPADAEPRPFAYMVVENSLLALQHLAADWYRRQPVPVTGVTGSVGKTTTKEVIAAVLSERYRAFKNPKNLNGEFGMPLAILLLDGSYERAVFEMGMERLGEIAQQCDWVQPVTGVLTNVGISHIEKLGTQEAIAAAKQELVEALPDAEHGGCAILNRSDPRVWAMAEHTAARVISYGWEPDADLWVDPAKVEVDAGNGIRFTMHERLSSGYYVARDVQTTLLGRHNALTCMAAAAVGFVNGMTWDEIARGLAQRPESARLVAKHGRNGAIILDDTYNAAPDSMKAALDTLAHTPGRRVAILGDMYELGHMEREAHEIVGQYAAEHGKLDLLLVVGPRARATGEAAIRVGFPRERVCFFDSTSETSYEPHAGDAILVKGSRGMAMERIVARLAEPELAGKP